VSVDRKKGEGRVREKKESSKGESSFASKKNVFAIRAVFSANENGTSPPEVTIFSFPLAYHSPFFPKRFLLKIVSLSWTQTSLP
jgi:hypothetical protein